MTNVYAYPASRGPSIFLDKSGRLPLADLSRKSEGPLLAGYVRKGINREEVFPKEDRRTLLAGYAYTYHDVNYATESNVGVYKIKRYRLKDLDVDWL